MRPLRTWSLTGALQGACGRLTLWNLDAAPAALAEAAGLLSPDESARAARFVFERDRRRFTLARATLRRVLGEALTLSPASLVFDYGEHGKPCLAAGQGAGDLFFNVSHSGERALIGWCRGAAIGVDIEAHRDLNDRDALVRRYFSAAENATYFALPAADQPLAFFRCWTRKEAVVKALGRGLGFSLEAFDVTLAPGEAARLQRLEALGGADAGWSLADVEVGEGYSAAVVLQGQGCAVESQC